MQVFFISPDSTLKFDSCVLCSIVSRMPPLRRTQNVITISDLDFSQSVAASAGTVIFGKLVELCGYFN